MRSAVVLLRPEADGPAISGVLREGTETERDLLHFRYRVIRTHETPVAVILSGGLATLPMAPLAAVSTEELPEIVRQM